MARHRSRERTVFLPWERQGTLMGQLGFSRARPFAAGVVVLVLCLWMASRERERAGVRSTRATLLTARQAVDLYRADANGDCPKGGWDEIVSRGYLASAPRDAWGSVLLLTCPSRHANKSYDVSSNGPDGEPGGLDRIE
jgi:general secretion pathway protein G